MLRLQGYAAIACMLSSLLSPVSYAQQAAPVPANSQAAPPAATIVPAPGLPPEPQPNSTGPLYMRPTAEDFSKSRNPFPNPIRQYMPIHTDPPRLSNSPRLADLVRSGKIYLSLSDAITLGLENNYDIAIQRYNLDIADTDLLRARSGSQLRFVNAGLVTGTLGGTTSTLTTGGGPGGTTTASGGAGASGSGTSSTAGAGTVPELLDPVLTGTLQQERTRTPQTSTFLTGTNSLSQNTDTYDFGYNQGFITGTGLTVGFNNTRSTSNSSTNLYSPTLQSNFRAELSQHLLYGFGPGVNGRFIIEAKNDRRISDSSFKQQILYTVDQIENIYWGLVSAYEDVQSKQRALQQSQQLASDNRKQLQIGTLAPLDVLNADNQVASDTQALISSQSNLQYQQLVMKQAISRNLGDPVLATAPVIPTDRVSLIEMPEEKSNLEELVAQAYSNRPEVEQQILALRNNEITLKGTKNGLLPQVDVYAFYGASAVGGAPSPSCPNNRFGLNCNVPNVGYGSVFQNLFNSQGPDKGAGLSLNIPIRNRAAQADQARAMLEYRQNEMRLEQLYVQIRIQVQNGQFALTNDRAAVQSALAAREYNLQSFQAEQKKLRLGASTTANVLQQERNLAGAENSVIAAEATYAKDRASLDQILANTLDRYGILLSDAVSGTVSQKPVIPGLEPAKAAPEATVPAQQEQLQKTEQPGTTPTPDMPAQPPLSPQEQQGIPAPPPPANPPAPQTPPPAPPQS